MVQKTKSNLVTLKEIERMTYTLLNYFIQTRLIHIHCLRLKHNNPIIEITQLVYDFYKK